MNRYRWIVMLTGLMVSGHHAWGFYRLFDDFEDELIGSVDKQDDWRSSGGDVRITEDPADASNQVLYVPSESSITRKLLASENTGILNGTARMLFMRIRFSQKQTFSVGLSCCLYPDQFGDFGPEIGMANSTENPDLRVWDDDGDNYEVLTSLAADQWYNLWVLVDAADDSYQLWLNSTPGADAADEDKLSAQDGDEIFDFRSGGNCNLNSFFIKTAGGQSSANSGPVYFDDIYLELNDTLNLSNPTVLEEPLPGDADLDGCVDMVDFSRMAGSWLWGPDPVMSWEAGNFDYDDAVDITDLLLMAEYWLQGCIENIP